MEDGPTRYFQIGFVVAWIVGPILFLCLWLYCIASYGFLLGVGLGWLPSAITAGLVGLLLIPLWGLLAAMLLAVVAWVIWANTGIFYVLVYLALLVAVVIGGKLALDAILGLFPKRDRRLDIPTPDWMNKIEPED